MNTRFLRTFSIAGVLPIPNLLCFGILNCLHISSNFFKPANITRSSFSKMPTIGKPSDNQGISKCINLSAPLSGDITRWSLSPPQYHLYTYFLPSSQTSFYPSIHIHHGADSPCHDLIKGLVHQGAQDGAAYAGKVPQRYVVMKCLSFPEFTAGSSFSSETRYLLCSGF